MKRRVRSQSVIWLIGIHTGGYERAWCKASLSGTVLNQATEWDIWAALVAVDAMCWSKGWNGGAMGLGKSIKIQ